MALVYIGPIQTLVSSRAIESTLVRPMSQWRIGIDVHRPVASLDATDDDAVLVGSGQASRDAQLAPDPLRRRDEAVRVTITNGSANNDALAKGMYSAIASWACFIGCRSRGRVS